MSYLTLSHATLEISAGEATGGSITATLTGDTFTDPLTGVTFSNLPTGLTGAATRTGDSTVSISFTGAATGLSPGQSVGVTVAFGDAAFTGGSAAAVTGSSRAVTLRRAESSAYSLVYAFSVDLSGKTYTRGVGTFAYNGKNYVGVSGYTQGAVIYEQGAEGSLSEVWGAGANAGYFHGGPAAVGAKLFWPARESGLYVYDLAKLGTDEFAVEKAILPPDAALTNGSAPKTTGIYYDAPTDTLYIFQRTGGWNAITGVSLAAIADLAISDTFCRYTTADYALETHRGGVVVSGDRRLMPAPSLSGNIVLVDDVSDGVAPVIQAAIRRNSSSVGCWDAKDIGNSRLFATQWSYPGTFYSAFGAGVYDLSRPALPRLMGRLIDSELPFYGANKDSPPYDLWLDGGLVLVAAGKTGLWAVNYDNPYTPRKETVAVVPDKPVDDFGYTSVAVIGGYAYAVACDIPNEAASSRLDAFRISGTKGATPALYRGFVQQGQDTPYLLDEFFTENYAEAEILNGTRNFPYCDWMAAVTPEVMLGEGKYHAAVYAGSASNERAIRLHTPSGKARRFSFVFTAQFKGTLPTAGQSVIMDVARVLTASSTGNPTSVVQVLATPNPSAPETLNTTLRVVREGGNSDVYYNGVASAAAPFTVRAQIDLDALTMRFKINDAEWKSGTIAGAVTTPDTFTVAVQRSNATDDFAYEIEFSGRFAVAEGLADLPATRGNVWELALTSAPSGGLKWEQGEAAQKASLGELAADGDWYYDNAAGKLYLYSFIDPNTADWGLYAG